MPPEWLRHCRGWEGEHELFEHSQTGRMGPRVWGMLCQQTERTGHVGGLIQLRVDARGQVYIFEGNHRARIDAQMGVALVPVYILYMGNSQRRHRLWDHIPRDAG